MARLIIRYAPPGMPVFMVDVKGDVAGLAMAGITNEKIRQRIAQIGIEGYTNEANPVLFWDLYGKADHPVRTTISEIGPELLGRILEINDTQVGMLEIVFKLADDHGLLLLDLEDLRALLGFVADQLILKPRLYSRFLLWLLSELFENLPEVGDLDKPKLVFFFDEAYLLFDDAPPMLHQRVEQVVRIIRSKGVGVYFCSQFPDDVPNEILGQLGIAFSMHCGLTRRVTRRQRTPPWKPSLRIRNLMSPESYPSLVLARLLFPHSRRRAFRCRRNAL